MKALQVVLPDNAAEYIMKQALQDEVTLNQAILQAVRVFQLYRAGKMRMEDSGGGCGGAD